MTDLVTWHGGSGAEYKYWAMEVGGHFSGVDGNYIWAKKNDSGWWEAVYIGQGDLATGTSVVEHYKGDVIMSKGATHIMVRANSNLDARLMEWADLLKGHPEAYEPEGCNGSGKKSTARRLLQRNA